MGVRKKIRKALKTFSVWKNRKMLFFFFKENAKNSFNIKRRIGFFTPLPPAQTGTAEYALKTYSTLLDDLDFISDFKTIEEYTETLNRISDKYKSHVIVQHFLKQTQKTYDHIILNLGNSYFHVPYLKYGIETKGKENRHIVLCETQLCGMLNAYCSETEKKNFKTFLKRYYPEKAHVIDEAEEIWEPFAKNNIFGIRAVIELTGIKHFFTYREIGKKMLKDDIAGMPYEKDVSVTLMPPVLEAVKDIRPTDLKCSGVSIGSFGIASDIKQTDKVIKAVDLLNEKGVPATLFLAGYDVARYCRKHPSDHVKAYENTDYDTLLSLIKSVDVAVQLRKFSLGEGSGCLAECLALNKKLIAAENLVEPVFKDFCHLVSSDISIENLAEALLKEIQRKQEPDTSRLIETYTVEKVGKKMLDVLEGMPNA